MTAPYGQERIATLGQLDSYLERLQNGRLPFRRLVVAGAVATTIRTVTASLTMLDTDRTILADATGGGVTVTLPAVADVPVGAELVVKRLNSGANAVAVQGATGAQTIDGATSVTLAAQYAVLRVQSDGLVWHVL